MTVDTYVPTHFKIEKEGGVLGKYLVCYSYDQSLWHAHCDDNGYPRHFDNFQEAEKYLSKLIKRNFGITIEKEK